MDPKHGAPRIIHARYDSSKSPTYVPDGRKFNISYDCGGLEGIRSPKEYLSKSTFPGIPFTESGTPFTESGIPVTESSPRPGGACPSYFLMTFKDFLMTV